MRYINLRLTYLLTYVAVVDCGTHSVLMYYHIPLGGRIPCPSSLKNPGTCTLFRLPRDLYPYAEVPMWSVVCGPCTGVDMFLRSTARNWSVSDGGIDGDVVVVMVSVAKWRALRNVNCSSSLSATWKTCSASLSATWRSLIDPQQRRPGHAHTNHGHFFLFFFVFLLLRAVDVDVDVSKWRRSFVTRLLYGSASCQLIHQCHCVCIPLFTTSPTDDSYRHRI